MNIWKAKWLTTEKKTHRYTANVGNLLEDSSPGKERKQKEPLECERLVIVTYIAEIQFPC